jgi:hypothetical protein
MRLGEQHTNVPHATLSPILKGEQARFSGLLQWAILGSNQ